MILKNVQRNFRRSGLFTTINIVDLSIGIAVSIMLLMFVLNEFSFDKHIKDSDRIVSLNTIMEYNGEKRELPVATRKAMTELPDRVPGIESVTQIYAQGKGKVNYENELFEDVEMHITQANFFDVFDIQFIIGSKDKLDAPNNVVVTDNLSIIMFGGVENAMNKTIKLNDREYTIVGVVKKLPSNTHFNFDILVSMDNDMKDWSSIEFFTFYKIEKGSSVDDVSKHIEKEYTVMVNDFLKSFSGKAYGATEKFTDIYLHSNATGTLGIRSNMNFVWILIIISTMILLLAITNFVNLFTSQGESRLKEIGVLKVNGAQRGNLITHFYSEIATLVALAFVIAIILSIIILPHFSKLIERTLDLNILFSPFLIFYLALLFIITTLLSGSYPAFYLSKFSSLSILTKKIQFSKRKLSSTVVVFQSVISIVLISYILLVNMQTNYLKDIPINYNPTNVMIVPMNEKIFTAFDAIEQELIKLSDVKAVSRAGHCFGGGASGQGISLLGSDNIESIDEYRVSPGMPELMELELVEGEFFKKDYPKHNDAIILNIAAIKMLGLDSPVVGTVVNYKGEKEIIGIVKDFIYATPQDKVEPIVLSNYGGNQGILYIKFDPSITRTRATQLVQDVFKDVVGESILISMWADDIYSDKFNTLETLSRILFYSSLLAVFISILGLLAIHFYTVSRRTREIAIRRVNGATAQSLFATLSIDIFRWLLIAGAIATPIVYFIATDWLNNYANKVSLNVGLFILPILLQFLIALISTSSITLKMISQNPTKSLKSE